MMWICNSSGSPLVKCFPNELHGLKVAQRLYTPQSWCNFRCCFYGHVIMQINVNDEETVKGCFMAPSDVHLIDLSPQHSAFRPLLRRLWKKARNESPSSSYPVLKCCCIYSDLCTLVGGINLSGACRGFFSGVINLLDTVLSVIHNIYIILERNWRTPVRLKLICHDWWYCNTVIQLWIYFNFFWVV